MRLWVQGWDVSFKAWMMRRCECRVQSRKRSSLIKLLHSIQAEKIVATGLALSVPGWAAGVTSELLRLHHAASNSSSSKSLPVNSLKH